MTLTYFNNCVNWDRDKVDTEDGLCEMITTGEDIDLETFQAQIDKTQWDELVKDLGYALAPEDGMTIQQDYHVDFQKGTLAGRQVVWMVHSAIEYVFTPADFSY